jgi:hypothetical protein
MRSRSFVLAIALAGVGIHCSSLNREGPDVTCASLEDGASNACADGIVAACASGVVVYRVCDDQSACGQDWQTEGAFRCDESEPVYEPVDAGHTPDGGTSPSGPGSTPDSGSSISPPVPEGGSSVCGPPSTCPIATATATIDALAVDSTNVYFSDCSSLWSVPKSGGVATAIASGLSGCAAGNLYVDETDVYVRQGPLTGATTIATVPKSGGALATFVADPDGIFQFTIDATNIYWTTSLGAIKKASLAGGSSATLTTKAQAGQERVEATGGYVYLPQDGAIDRVTTTATAPMGLSSIAVDNAVNDFAVSDSAIYLTAPGAQDSAGLVESVSLASGVVTELAGARNRPQAIATDGANVYWSDFSGIQKVAISGGAPMSIATANTNGRLFVDNGFVYWANGIKIMRAAK